MFPINLPVISSLYRSCSILNKNLITLASIYVNKIIKTTLRTSENKSGSVTLAVIESAPFCILEDISSAELSPSVLNIYKKELKQKSSEFLL